MGTMVVERTRRTRRSAGMRFFPSMVISSALAFAVAVAACSGGPPASPVAEGVRAATPGDAAAPGDPPGDPPGDAAGDDGGDPFAACGSVAATGTIPADVEAVLQARCQTCHSDPPINNAPFPLLTYAEIHQDFVTSVPKYEEMYFLIQPGADPQMPFGNAPQLSTDQFNALATWLKSCAPPG
jgi:hypothetical protein